MQSWKNSGHYQNMKKDYRYSLILCISCSHILLFCNNKKNHVFVSKTWQKTKKKYLKMIIVSSEDSHISYDPMHANTAETVYERTLMHHNSSHLHDCATAVWEKKKMEKKTVATRGSDYINTPVQVAVHAPASTCTSLLRTRKSTLV